MDTSTNRAKRAKRARNEMVTADTPAVVDIDDESEADGAHTAPSVSHYANIPFATCLPHALDQGVVDAIAAIEVLIKKIEREAKVSASKEKTLAMLRGRIATLLKARTVGFYQ